MSPSSPPQISLTLTYNSGKKSVIKDRTRDKTTDSKAVNKTIVMSRGRSHVAYNFGMVQKKNNYRHTRPFSATIGNYISCQDITAGIAIFS